MTLSIFRTSESQLGIQSTFYYALKVDRCHDPQLQRPYISLKENYQHCHVPSSPKRNLCRWTSVPLSGAHKVHYLAGISNRHRSPCHFSGIPELNDQRIYGFWVWTRPFPAWTRYVISNRSSPLKFYHLRRSHKPLSSVHEVCYPTEFQSQTQLGYLLITFQLLRVSGARSHEILSLVTIIQVPFQCSQGIFVPLFNDSL